MNGKKIVTTLAIVTALTVPISVFAATSDTTAAKKVRGFFGIDASNFTEQQKADVNDYTQKMKDLQKEYINKMVSNGSMTKEQGDEAIKKIDEGPQNGDMGIFGKGMERGGPGGQGRQGGPGGHDMLGIDFTKLTEQQKADLTEETKKVNEAQKALINKMVANGSMAKEHGDQDILRIDEAANKDVGKGFGFGELQGFGVRSIDVAQLTDVQKNELTDSLKVIAEAQKSLINKMVSNGAFTKEQGDAAIAKIDEMAKNDLQNGLPKDKGMMDKGFKGRDNSIKADSSKNSNQ